VSLDQAVLAFGAFVSFLVAAGIVLAFYAPAYREEARRDDARPGRVPADAGGVGGR
jgi:hypothetical protein